MDVSGWHDISARANAARKAGKLRGIDLATYIEACSFPEIEEATLTLDENGTVTLLIGTQTNGQGHATTYAQFIAGHLGLTYNKIEVIQGDTDRVPRGEGTGDSRSIPLGAVSVDRAATKLAEQLKTLAAPLLESDVSELSLSDGAVRVGATNRGITLAELAKSAHGKSQLTAVGEFEQPEPTYANGTPIVEVEIDLKRVSRKSWAIGSSTTSARR